MTKSGGGSIVFNGSAIAHRGYANHDMMAAKGAVAGGTSLECMEQPMCLRLDCM